MEKNQQGEIKSVNRKKFDAKSTASEVIEGHDLTGYEIIVTGWFSLHLLNDSL